MKKPKAKRAPKKSVIHKANAMVVDALELVLLRKDRANDPLGTLHFIQQLFVAALTLGEDFAPGMLDSAMRAAQDHLDAQAEGPNVMGEKRSWAELERAANANGFSIQDRIAAMGGPEVEQLTMRSSNEGAFGRIR